MGVLDFILDGLEKALELERELGVRSIEFDRGLLESGEAVSLPLQEKGRISSCTSGKDSASPLRSGKETASSLSATPSRDRTVSDLVFLHDRPLSPGGVEMMAKILTALGKSDAPIVVVPPTPQAKIVVVLGGLALRKYFPGMRGEPGQWKRTPEGQDVLITYSPEYILRFGAVTPAVKKIKEDMWRSLKAVKQRLNG